MEKHCGSWVTGQLLCHIYVSVIVSLSINTSKPGRICQAADTASFL
jgi:hypothetical protein